MAGIKAKQANPDADVLILEKANIRRSGAIAMGMDGVNTAVIPGNSTPEQYVREITIANENTLGCRDRSKQIEQDVSVQRSSPYCNARQPRHKRQR